MIQVVKRVFDLLSILRRVGPMPLKDLAEAAGLNKTTCHNILKSLHQLDMVDCPEPGVYRIGGGLRHLASVPVDRQTLTAAAEDHVRQLAGRTGESTILAMLEGTDVKVVCSAEGAREVVVRREVQHSGSVYFWATGRVLLAWADTETVDRIVDQLGLPRKADWPETAGSRKKLDTQLKAVRRKKVLERPAGDGGVLTLAAPVRDTDGNVVAALGMAVPGYRARRELTDHRRHLHATAEAITRRLAGSSGG